MLRFAMMLASVILGSSRALGQSPATEPPPLSPSEPTSAPQLPVEDATDALAGERVGENERAWEFSATGFMYVIPDERDYAAATFTADWDWLHLEGRYNYEDIDTGSVWTGINFSFGEELTLDVTPMIGSVFGNTEGIAPGYEITLAWRQFELYTEGEFVFDLNDSADNFCYSWSEFSYYPADWLRVGLVVQRTKAYETDFDIQRGFLIGLSYENVDFTTYVFNPDEDPTLVFALTLNF